MTTKMRILSLLLALCLLASCLPAASAAAPASMTVSELAAAASSVATGLESFLKTGLADAKGVYTGFATPETMEVGAYAIDLPSYTVMAARAVCALSEGKSADTAIAYEAVTYTGDEASCGSATSVNRGQYLDLAERVVIFAETGNGSLATSFNAPTDGYIFYDGRISIHSVALILTKALQSYAADGSLPESVSFLPSHYSNKVLGIAGLSGSYAEVVKAAMSLVDYVSSKKAMPSTITVGSTACKPAQFLYLAGTVLLGISNGQVSGTLAIPSYSEPENPSETITAGKLTLSEVLTVTQNAVNFTVNNSRGPNYMTCALGQIHYHAGIYMMAYMLAQYATTGALPASYTMKTWFETTGGVAGNATFGNDYSAHAKYLVPTKNCQSTNATIISVAKTGMLYSSGGYSSPTNTYQAMWNLEKYLNAKITYSSYSDTARGALKTWNDKYGNCCDMAHLANACARALGVPGQYQHGYCRFSTFSTGHVWSRVYCGADRGWLIIDVVSSANYLGYKSNTTVTFYNTYAELPF